AGHGPGRRDPDDHLGIVLAGHLERERPRQLAEEGPLDRHNAFRAIDAGAALRHLGKLALGIGCWGVYDSVPFRRMSWFRRLWGGLGGGGSGSSARDAKAKRVDYLVEALSLERRGGFQAPLASYRPPLP